MSGRWNAAYRDMEAELIPMAEDQGMAIVPWAALGGGALQTKEVREKAAHDEGARKAAYGQTEHDIRVSEALEEIAKKHQSTLHAVVSRSLI